ncbi:transposase [Novipirellula artificiosorum]|uniref:Transposase IS200 like protein n=1 Tax=Novipirellula artificiosorum TaxID=2528016 RepID=A0A5C6DU56_9BACT|nr:transposase [Novipirellula artificiosorum]TWU39764.1 Transposase IS200 like protein [Novipirellula artificiosorum]
MDSSSQSRLRRLPAEFYRGYAWVHWIMTIDDRRTAWLDGKFYYKFREILTHVAFRNQIACPIFCMMPDHIHLLCCGLAESTDQRVAMKRLRLDANDCLKRIGYSFQRQPYDHVLRDKELEKDAIESVCDYIARNPERKGLVPIDGFADYPYTSCLLPGYPQIRLFEPTSWDTVWRTISFLKRTQCFHTPDPKRTP